MEACRLVTPYTTERGYDPGLLAKLEALRQYDYDSGDVVPFKWPTTLRHVLPNNQDLKLREYQKVMIHHLARMPRFINGDAVGLGKTLDAIAASCWLYDRMERMKVVILTTKSTTWQWYDEYEKFSTLRPFVMQDDYRGESSYNARYLQLENFLKGNKRDIMVCKYTSMIGKRRVLEGQQFDEDGYPLQGGKENLSQEIKTFAKILKPHYNDLILILDECHKFKSVDGATRALVMALQHMCKRVWALSATVIKNNLAEFYSIASAIGIRPCGNMADFYNDYCIFETRKLGAGRYKDELVGYVPDKIREFKQEIRPFFLGRSQRQVKEPLPQLTTVYHAIDLNERQSKLLLEEIPSGDFQLPPAAIKRAGQIVYKERDPDNMMTMLSVYQLVANHPGLLDKADEKGFFTSELSPKEETLLDMLDGDYRGEKVIVFTKYRSWIDRLEYLTKNGKFTERKFLRITGAENEKQRNVNKKLFQDPDSGYDVIFINSAAMEGVNLQSAAHMILLDVPWSWGDLIQLVGRMVRMASPHAACMLHVLAAKGTIDEYAIETLKGKKGVFEIILGESHSAGILDDRMFLDLESGMEQAGTDEEFQKLLKAHAKSVSMKNYLTGVKLEEAQSDEEYQMVFQKDKKAKKGKRISDEEFDRLRSKW